MNKHRKTKHLTLNAVIINERKNPEFEQAFQKELLINEIASQLLPDKKA